MPELPEVETIRTQLEPLLLQRAVVSAWAFESAKFSPAMNAVGLRFVGLRRRGKYLLADMIPCEIRGQSTREPQHHELILHMGMTGRLTVAEVEGFRGERRDSLEGGGHGEQGSGAHLRAWWDLDDGRRLTFHDQRRFGRVALVCAGDYSTLATLAALGPEPLGAEFTPERLRAGLTGRRAVKTALLSQRIVAGIGNIYADEALWLAGVRPTARRLGADRARGLHSAIVAVLRQGLTNGGTTLRDYRDAAGSTGTNQIHLSCYGRAGEPCYRCGGLLTRGIVDARGTTWCATCQH